MSTDEKITWVIGDIHGACDPVRAMVDYLDDGRVDKFVFTGDFVDHGPSSKQVLDFVMSLGDRAVCLLGNHEHLLLDTLYNERHRENWGYRVWDENGAKSTIRSFGYRDFAEFEANLEPKYTDFLKNLGCFHTETFTSRNQEVKFLITHGGVMPNIPVAEQMAVKNYAQLNQFMEERHIWIEDVFIWIRDGFLKGDPAHWQDYIVIHGHTPTHLLPHSIQKSLPEAYDVFTPYIRRHPQTGRMVSVDIDTGAAFGHRLSAVGLCQRFVEGEYPHGPSLQLVQLDTKKGYYRSQPFERTLIELVRQ